MIISNAKKIFPSAFKIFFCSFELSIAGVSKLRSFQIWRFFAIATFARVEKYRQGPCIWFSFPKKLFSDDWMYELLLCVCSMHFFLSGDYLKTMGWNHFWRIFPFPQCSKIFWNLVCIFTKLLYIFCLIIVDPFWGFSLKTVLGIHDPRISSLLFGTKNHKIQGPPVVSSWK